MPEPEPVPTLDAIRRAIEAGMGPRAVMMARQLSRQCDTETMLQIADLLSARAMFAPLAGMWRHRDRDPREAAPYATALNGLATEMIEQGRHDDAMRVLEEAREEAREEAPELRYVARNMASLLLLKGEYEGAIARLEDLLAQDLTDAESAELLGIARYDSGDPALAIDPLGQAFDAGRADAGLWLAKALVLNGDDRAALAVVNRLALEHPDRAAAMLALELDEPGSPLQMLRDLPGFPLTDRPA